VLEGPQLTVDRVIVRGNRRTESEVIRRTIEVRPGDPVSDARLLQAERTLYRLGIFSRVDVEFARPGLETETRDVVIRVEEGKPRSLTYGVGFDSEDGVRGLLGFTHNNIGGQAYTLRTDLRLAQRNSRFRALFDQPYVFKYPVPLTSSIFYEEGQVGRDAFEVTRYGARTEASRNYESRRVGLGLDYRVVELKELAEGTGLNELERKDRPVQIASIFPSFFWDRRDDPLLATRGWSSLAQLQYAFPALGSQANFVKLFLQQTQYLGVGRAGVVAASLRAGGIEAFNELAPDDPDVTNDLASRNVFISERFFAGGSTTHRAYDRDELGIRGESLLLPENETNFVPIGGNGLLLFNLEYRFPIAGAFGGTVFYDVGNVWADWREIDPGEIKSGVGLGVRYLSPIGPLRVDVGYKLDREDGEDAYAVYLSFGNPF
jgi:outer membrane protein insertion porin family